MRIASLNKDRCQPKKCQDECIRFCPRVRMGDETVVKGARGKPVISEALCVGCGICVHKCPHAAIKIIQLPEELEEDLMHQYGVNGFRLFRLPVPKEGLVIGLLGSNGIGKTTAMNILSGLMVPNLGDYENEPTWDDVLDTFSGSPIHDHMRRVADNEIRPAVKPQYVDKIAVTNKGTVNNLLTKVDETSSLDEISVQLDIEGTLKKDIDKLSGGELQRVALAATMLKDADIYFFDEPSSYLDIYQRLRISRILQKLAEKKQILVIEHDLAILDFLADNIYLMYGSQGAYGVMAHPRATKAGVNAFLEGYLKEENIRIRDWGIKFPTHPPREDLGATEVLVFPGLRKKYPGFTLDTQPGIIREGEVVGVLGPNATGKTTFVQMLAGELKPDKGKVSTSLAISYKPQYISTEYEGEVIDLFYTELGERYEDKFYKNEIEGPLNLKVLYNRKYGELSGGELQRVALGLCLGKEADLFLIDEPSAYLDVNQRMESAKVIRRVMEKSAKTGFLVDHDIYFIDLVSDSLMVFQGDSATYGVGDGPFDLREGMNKFLKDLDITFRRDMDTKRPRINKHNSTKDREQKVKGEYYYE
jgi:ATP-binding cassette subfamily E protein 1